MGKPAAYYNSDDFNKYKKTQGKCIPPRSNVLAAACHIQALFDTKKFTYGFFGGLPMLCMGYKREMPDLHVAYDDRDFDRMTAKLGSDRRVRLPTGMNPLLPFKILVWTGPDYKDLGCEVNASIELDLIPSGSCGTPSAGTLSRNVIHLGLKTASGNQMIFKSLNFRHQLATLLSYCQVRDLLWDPRKDILYLCKSETSEVRSCRGQLNIKHLKELFLGTSFFSRLSLEDQRLCYRTLLDTEPPPSMSVTPPDPQDPTQPRSKPKDSEQSSDARTPRSRYRHTNGQRSSSNGLQIAQDTKPRRPEQVQATAHTFNIQGVQCVQSARPQTVSTANATRKPHNSMPDLQASQEATNSHHSSNRTSRRATAKHGQHESPQLIHTSGQQVPVSPQQTQTGSNLEYGGAFRPAYIQKRDENINVGRSPLSGRDISPRRTDSAKSDSTATPVREIHSQKGSLHIVSPEEPELVLQKDFKDNTPARGRLRLVGPEGVYGAPDATQKNGQSQNQQQRQRHRSAPPPLNSQHNFVFELDATEAPKPTFIAELPADPIISSFIKPQGQFHDRSNLQAPLRPSNSRAQSEPFEVASLPPSLAIGGPSAHTHHQSIIHSQSSNEEVFAFSTRQTNAYRYSSFAYPQSASSEGLAGPLEKAEGPSYKPYRPFIFTDELDRHNSVSSVYSPRHRRDASDDSTASHDSSKLAKEYQDLLSPVKAYGDD